MKLSVNTQLLAQELRLLDKIAESKPTIPILSHVLLTTDGATLRLSATDLDVVLQTQCPATIHAPGSATFSARHLLQLVEQFSDEAMTISDDGKVSCGTFKSKLQCLPVDEYPALPTAEGEMMLFSEATLATAIARVQTALPDKAAKHQVEGALLTSKDGTSALVSLDGKRMAVATLPYTGAPLDEVIIPSKMLRLLPSASSVTVAATAQHLFFTQGVRQYASRRLEGAFPAYQRVLPTGNPYTAVLPRAACAAALRRVGLAADLSAKFTFRDGMPSTLSMAASNVTVGEAEEVVPVIYTGPELTITLRWRDLLDFFTTATTDEVSLAIKDANTSVLASSGNDFLTALMVMR